MLPFLGVMTAAELVSPAMYTNSWYQARAHVADTHKIVMTIVVKEQGLAEIKRIATAVSDPASPEYGKYLSQSQIEAISTPSKTDMTAVTSWLAHSGLSYTQRGVSNLVVTTNASFAAKLFNTQFHYATNQVHKQTIVRAGAYTIPSRVESSIATIFGLHGLPLPPKQALVIKSYAGANSGDVTPAVLASTYSIKGVTPAHSTKNAQAVAEFQGQNMNSTDLVTLFKKYVKTYTPGTDDVVSKYLGKHLL